MMSWGGLITGNLILASLIAALAVCVGHRGERARLAHLLWVLFFVKLITPPLVTIPVPIPQAVTAHWPSSQRMLWSPAPGNSPLVPGSTGERDGVRGFPERLSVEQAATAVQTPTIQLSVTGWLTSIWLFGVLALTGRGVWRLIRFQRLIEQCGRVDELATAVVKQMLDARYAADQRTARFWFGFHRRPSPQVIRVSVRVSPMLVGFGRQPRILCPDQLWDSLSPQDRQAFLAHETGHFYRRDHWVRWLEWIVSVVYWWFPGVYFARQQLERHEEACCDAWAIQTLRFKPRDYAEALLRVVDFISDHTVGIPRLASGMQPTATLEERLRLLMRRDSELESANLPSKAAGVICLVAWLVHPIAIASPVTSIRSPGRVDELLHVDGSELVDPFRLDVPETTEPSELPEPPRGFWNRATAHRWAAFTLPTSGARLEADTDHGITIEPAGLSTGGSPNRLRFAANELTCIAEIAASGRVVIGDAQGRVRIWDLQAGVPVSLVGQHAAAVTSIVVTDDGGVVSGDAAGSVIRWDAQSGRVLASWSRGYAESMSRPAAAIQSVRCSDDQTILAVLSGDWQDQRAGGQIEFLDATTLQPRFTATVPAGSAVVVQHPQQGWIVIDWSGTARTVNGLQAVMTIPKLQMSALVLSPQSPVRSATNSIEGD